MSTKEPLPPGSQPEVQGEAPEPTWWPSWSCTRLHAIEGTPTFGIFGTPLSPTLCGAPVEHPDKLSRSEWHRERLSREIPKCKRCLAKLGSRMPSPAPSTKDTSPDPAA